MSRKFSIVLFFVIVLNNFSTAQNLVLNPDMEDTTATYPLPPGIWQSCGPCYAPPWFQPYPGSADYFNFNFWVNHMLPQPVYPDYYDNVFGYQLPKSGLGMMGIGVYIENYSNYREFIQGLILDSLKSGHTYCVSMFVSLSNNSGRAIGNIGLKFYSDSVLTPGNLLLGGQIPDLESTQMLSDTLNWIQISGSYTAWGGEKFFIIGNLRTDSNTNVTTVTPEHLIIGMTESAYYYIDDVSVTDCTVGLEEHNTVAQLQFTPNPTAGGIEFDLEINQQSVAEVLDITGRVVLKQELERGGKRHNIDMKALPGGVYLVRVLAGGRPLAAGRVVKM